MAILLTGGTGKTSTRLASLLRDANIPFLLTSRKGQASAPSGMQAAKFDWTDPSTYANPFSVLAENTTAIYLIAPEMSEPVTPMNEFIDYAIASHGVKRFVMLAGTTLVKGGDMYTGKVWSHLEELNVEYCVLQATWFMENFSEWHHLTSIRDESKVYSCTGDGRVPFVSAKDIAALAFHTLTDNKSHNTNYFVLGPELLTHDQIAAKLSTTLNRTVTHVKLSPEEAEKRFLEMGMTEHYAKFMTGLEIETARGMEEKMWEEAKWTTESVTGRRATRFDVWAKENKKAWKGVNRREVGGESGRFSG